MRARESTSFFPPFSRFLPLIALALFFFLRAVKSALPVFLFFLPARIFFFPAKWMRRRAIKWRNKETSPPLLRVQLATSKKTSVFLPMVNQCLIDSHIDLKAGYEATEHCTCCLALQHTLPRQQLGKRRCEKFCTLRPRPYLCSANRIFSCSVGSISSFSSCPSARWGRCQWPLRSTLP